MQVIKVTKNQKQHLQSKGHRLEFPPFPMLRSSSLYIFSPPSIFFVEGISPSFIILSFCSILNCILISLAIFLSFFSLFIYYSVFCDDSAITCWAFYYFFVLKMSSMILRGFLGCFFMEDGLDELIWCVFSFVLAWIWWLFGVIFILLLRE